MEERRELGIGGDAAECARRSGAGLGFRSRHAQLRPGPRALCPARALARCERPRAHRALCGTRRGRTGDHDPPSSGVTVAPANAVPGGLARPAAQRRPPAPGSCRSREGASPAPGAPPPPARRSRPQPGCHHPLTPGAEDPAPPAVPASEGVTDRVQEGPPQLFTPPCLPRAKSGDSGS